MAVEVQKGESLFHESGLDLLATDDLNYAIMEWSDEHACQLALQVDQMLRRHALSTNFVQDYSRCALVVRRLELLPVTVVVRAGGSDTILTWVDQQSEERLETELLTLPGVQKSRIGVMKDGALHTARCLRAYLTHSGGEFTLRLRFGITMDGECLLQVIDPLACDFGSLDYESALAQLGGNDI